MKYDISNVRFMVDQAEKKDTSHNNTILNYQQQTPRVLILQNHVNNLRSVFSDAEIMNVVELLGINKSNLNKAG